MRGAQRLFQLVRHIGSVSLGNRPGSGVKQPDFMRLMEDHNYEARQISEDLVIVTPQSSPKHPIFVRLDRADPYIFEEIFIAEIYNLDNTRIGKKIDDIYQRLSRTGVPLILDLGANIGYASVYYARRYPSSFAVSIECEGDNFKLLCKNTESFPSILPLHGAVDSEGGRPVYIADRDDESTTSIYRSCRFVVRPGGSLRAGGAQVIQTYTVDDLVARAKELQPDIVPFLCKVDIEGYEKQLFARNTGWLEPFRVLIGEGHDHVYPGERTAHGMLLSAAQYGFDIMAQSSNFLAVKYE